MGERAQKEAALVNALKQCWYLPEEEKKFWLDNIETLPAHTLDNVTGEVAAANKIMDESIIAAINNNPGNTFLQQIKNAVNKIKKTAFEIEEGARGKQAERKLKQKLKEL